ncbi:iron ABC transporter substrate-binding protein [Nesterenkonia alkaliphila]|uniref:Extracellular solute-binding protein n=1 Tax=Nesterenkonia alkaliphila TaxID=1463631 RepID=A0A7K1UN16_9MICC|nr:iron ABC transporter substrate-binding protein [Nesterenkonia alkaliphila]MVT27411.1 extracellular solute-binding protein [Nesterenkonia alkaliphila]GFZ89990.1 iron ABC transporter substrate-binding protein [Nesterenkonia alkaliphila]
MTRTTRAALALTAAAALVLTACGDNGGGDSNGNGADSAEAGSLVLYSGRNEELIQPLIDQFEEESGIEVSVRYGDTAELAAQLIEEGQATPADVFLAQDAGALGAVAQEGLFAELDQELLVQVPEIYRDNGNSWVGLSGRLRTLIYNTDLVEESELPETVAELTGPEYAGRVGIAPTNASFQAFVTGFRISEGDQTAQQWLSDLAGNDPQYRDRNGPIVSDVIDGALEMGLVNHYYLYAQAAERGVEPEELPAANHLFGDGDIGALMNVTGAGVFDAQNQGAVDLLEYLLSEEGQQYFVEETAEYAMVEGFEAPAGLPPLQELDVPDIDLNQLEDLETTIQMITEAGLAG